MNTPLVTYRAVAIEYAGPYRADCCHPLVVAGYHELLLRRASGGVVDKVHYLPVQRADALATARQTIDMWATQGFSWVGPPEPTSV